MIRKAELDDVKDVSYMIVTNWKNSYRGIIEDSFLDNINCEDKEKEQIEYLKNGNSNVYLYFEEGNTEVLGLIAFEIKDNIIEVTGLDVNLKYKRRKIGTFLVEFVKEEAYRLGVDKICFKSFAEDSIAISFFEYIGAKTVKLPSIITPEFEVPMLGFEYEI